MDSSTQRCHNADFQNTTKVLLIRKFVSYSTSRRHFIFHRNSAFSYYFIAACVSIGCISSTGDPELESGQAECRYFRAVMRPVGAVQNDAKLAVLISDDIVNWLPYKR